MANKGLNHNPNLFKIVFFFPHGFWASGSWALGPTGLVVNLALGGWLQGKKDVCSVVCRVPTGREFVHRKIRVWFEFALGRLYYVISILCKDVIYAGLSRLYCKLSM